MHDCDPACICPLCGERLQYNPYLGIHACPTYRCKNRPGLTVVPTTTLAPVEW